MRPLQTALLVLSTLCLLTLVGCGDEGDDESSNRVDGAVLFGAQCADCHDLDGSDITGTSAETLAAAIDGVPAMAGLQGVLSETQLAAIGGYLDTGTHSRGWNDEDAHGGYARARGVAVCEVCHGGPDLTGTAGFAPSCFSCHGRKW